MCYYLGDKISMVFIYLFLHVLVCAICMHIYMCLCVCVHACVYNSRNLNISPQTYMSSAH